MGGRLSRRISVLLALLLIVQSMVVPVWALGESNSCSHGWHPAFSTPEVIKPATCTEKGVTRYKCFYCDQYYQVTDIDIDPDNHDWCNEAGECTRCHETHGHEKESKGIKCKTCGYRLGCDHTDPSKIEILPAIPGNCISTGKAAGKKCTACDTIFDGREELPVNPSVHPSSSIVVIPALAPSCTVDGLTEGRRCTACGATVEAQQVVHATGHIKVIEPAVEPTCTEAGSSEGRYCSICGLTIIYKKPLPAKGHTIVTDAAVAASCAKTGLSEGSHCSVCGTVLVAQNEIPTIDHTVVIDRAITASCDSCGLTEGSHCSVCGVVLVKQNEIPATGHTIITDNAVAATCTKAGLTEGSHCSVCKKVLVKQKEIPATGHTIVTDAAVAASCTKAGLTEGSHCSVCKKVLVKQKEIPATGHTIVTDAAVAATCTKAGLTEGSHCSVCQKVLVKQKEIPALEHRVQTVSGKAATCTKTGLTDGKKCTVCGKVTQAQREIAALGHDMHFNQAGSSADYVEFACSRCERSESWSGEQAEALYNGQGFDIEDDLYDAWKEFCLYAEAQGWFTSDLAEPVSKESPIDAEVLMANCGITADEIDTSKHVWMSAELASMGDVNVVYFEGTYTGGQSRKEQTQLAGKDECFNPVQGAKGVTDIIVGMWRDDNQPLLDTRLQFFGNRNLKVKVGDSNISSVKLIQTENSDKSINTINIYENGDEMNIVDASVSIDEDRNLQVVMASQSGAQYTLDMPAEKPSIYGDVDTDQEVDGKLFSDESNSNSSTGGATYYTFEELDEMLNVRDSDENSYSDIDLTEQMDLTANKFLRDALGISDDDLHMSFYVVGMNENEAFVFTTDVGDNMESGTVDTPIGEVKVPDAPDAEEIPVEPTAEPTPAPVAEPTPTPTGWVQIVLGRKDMREDPQPTIAEFIDPTPEPQIIKEFVDSTPEEMEIARFIDPDSGTDFYRNDPTPKPTKDPNEIVLRRYCDYCGVYFEALRKDWSQYYADAYCWPCSDKIMHREIPAPGERIVRTGTCINCNTYFEVKSDDKVHYYRDNYCWDCSKLIESGKLTPLHKKSHLNPGYKLPTPVKTVEKSYI